MVKKMIQMKRTCEIFTHRGMEIQAFPVCRQAGIR